MIEKDVTTREIPRGYIRREEAAKYLGGISLRTLSEWQRQRLIPFIKVSHRVTLFKVKDLDRALDRLKVRAVEVNGT